MATGYEFRCHNAIVAVSPTQEACGVDRGSDDSPLRLNQRLPTNIGPRSAASQAGEGSYSPLRSIHEERH